MSKFNKMRMLAVLMAGAGVLSACSSGRLEQAMGSDAAVKVADKPIKFALTDTMQNTCFDNAGKVMICAKSEENLYGQDAQYSSLQPSFTDNKNATITDNNSGLMWQKSPDFSKYSYDDAISYCAKLNVASYTDWRLPTIKELYSIADFRGELVNPHDVSKNTPYIDTKYFDFKYDERMAFAGQYWSMTKYTQGPVHNTENVDAAFGFNFADGHIKAYETGYVFGSTDKSIRAPGNYVRCVRGAENIYGVNDFVKNSDGTVTDKATGLMWQQKDDGVRRDWQDSLAYAESSKLAGYEDWRLPNIKELQSIVKYGGKVGADPAIDTQFFNLTGKNTVADPLWVWSSTTQGDFKYTAAYIAFGKAYSKKSSSDTKYYDWHGAGAQRSDPKYGNPADYEMASINAADLVMTKNYVLMVRAAVVSK